MTQQTFHSDVAITYIDPDEQFAFGSCRLDGGSVFISRALTVHLIDAESEVDDVWEMRLRPQRGDRHTSEYAALSVVTDAPGNAAVSYAHLREKMQSLSHRLKLACQRIAELEGHPEPEPEPDQPEAD